MGEEVKRKGCGCKIKQNSQGYYEDKYNHKVFLTKQEALDYEHQFDIRLLALDVGTTYSGYCIIDSETYKPIKFGKIENHELLDIVHNEHYSKLAVEWFQSYGNRIGNTVLESVCFNGRYVQTALDRNIPVFKVPRKDEKMNLVGNTKCKDKDIRLALIKRFAKFDKKNGKGTKKNPDWFYGFANDMWAAYAVGVTYLDGRGEEVI